METFRVRILISIAGIATTTLVAAACDTPTLSAGATLSVSFEASVLHPAPPPASLPTSKAECVAAGGAVVDLRAWGSDGQPAHDVQVTMWLAPAASAQLHPLSTSCASEDDVCVVLDDGGEGNACLLPGANYGTIMVFAHSGTIQQSTSIAVGAYTLVPGSTIALSIAPNDVSDVVTTTARRCGVPTVAPCAPGRSRSASVAVAAATPDGTALPPDGTVVVLDATAGWLVGTGGCAGPRTAGPLSLVTSNGTTGATWCFGDAAASGVLQARSGTVSAMATQAVAAIPQSLSLTSSSSTVQNGGTVTLTAVVTGCDGAGVIGNPVLFRATAGSAQLSSSTPVSTNSDGIATVTATIGTPPASFIAAIANAQSVDCDVTVGAAP